MSRITVWADTKDAEGNLIAKTPIGYIEIDSSAALTLQSLAKGEQIHTNAERAFAADMRRAGIVEVVDAVHPDSFMVFLEQAGAGCISGAVSEWPQLKPACRWAAKYIKWAKQEIRCLEADRDWWKKTHAQDTGSLKERWEISKREVERLTKVINDTSAIWIERNPGVAWEGGLPEAMAAAVTEIERLRKEVAHEVEKSIQPADVSRLKHEVEQLTTERNGFMEELREIRNDLDAAGVSMAGQEARTGIALLVKAVAEERRLRFIAAGNAEMDGKAYLRMKEECERLAAEASAHKGELDGVREHLRLAKTMFEREQQDRIRLGNIANDNMKQIGVVEAERNAAQTEAKHAAEVVAAIRRLVTAENSSLDTVSLIEATIFSLRRQRDEAREGCAKNAADAVELGVRLDAAKADRARIGPFFVEQSKGTVGVDEADPIGTLITFAREWNTRRQAAEAELERLKAPEYQRLTDRDAEAFRDPGDVYQSIRAAHSAGWERRRTP